MNEQIFGTIFITNDRRVCLVKGRQQGKWSFPKGHAKPGETGFETARRETMEEIGFFPSYSFSKIVHLAVGHYFVYTCTEFPVESNDPDEIEAIAWLSLDSIQYHQMNSDVKYYYTRFWRELNTKAKANANVNRCSIQWTYRMTSKLPSYIQPSAVL
jgi:8-oxo-dGTP pyrophosphatase MutT (NUDIX family)